MAKEMPDSGQPSRCPPSANAARLTTKLANIYITTWPPIMLPNSRIDRVSGRTTKEMTSIRIIIGRMKTGTPLGTNRLKNFRPFFQKPITRTEMKVSNARATVQASWAVTVKVSSKPARFPTASQMPIMLKTSTTMKMVKTNGT